VKLAPIERPRSWLVRLAFWMARRRLGAVPTPFKVIYARAPKLLFATHQIAQTVDRRLSLDEELVLLVTTQSSLLNGCGFCADLHMAEAVRARLGLEKFRALPEYAASATFSDRERAALAYTEEVTRTRRASQASFDALRKHFSEREIVELTWLNAIGNFFNLMAVPLELESDDLLALALERAR
jgi:AhpD family alkylhydroperoxidase